MHAIRRALCCALLSSAALSACGDDETVESRSCDEPFTGAQLEGQWHIEADGRRLGCSNRDFEGDLEVRTAFPIEVIAEAQATSSPATGPDVDNPPDAFVARIERADFELDESRDAPDEVSVTGLVTGSCFRFTIVEQLDDGDSLRYEFDGWLTSRGRARGEFWGQGPEDCEVEGTFELNITP